MTGSLREKMIDSQWRSLFSPDEDAAKIEAEKAAWPEDMARAERRADAAILALREWLEAEGLAVVPREATHDMMTHAMLFRSVAERPPHVYDTAGVYRTMIAAAPDALKPPEPHQ
jgi:hypothetical protein